MSLGKRTVIPFPFHGEWNKQKVLQVIRMRPVTVRQISPILLIGGRDTLYTMESLILAQDER